MSGLLGGTGSKSGVLGQTEIRYETGTWTPVLKYNANAGGDEIGEFTVSYKTYTRIGNLVHLELRMQHGGSNTPNSLGTNTLVISNLPFTTQDSPYRAIGSAVATNYFNMTVMCDNWAADTINFAHGTGDGYLVWNQVTSSGQIAFYAIYQTPDA